MGRPEDALAQAERHVREGEARIARLTRLINDLDGDRQPDAAARARAGELLATMQESLKLARRRLRMQRKERDLER